MAKNQYDKINGKKVAFLNLGCKVNSYETEAMQQMFEKAGAMITDFSEKSDIYVVNTCTVTNVADRKSRQMLHKAKKMNVHSVVVAVGCYVQAAQDELEKDLSVDLLIGNNHKKRIVEIVNELLSSQELLNSQELVGSKAAIRPYVTDISEESVYEDLSIETVYEKTRAYIKIQDGCNQFCSYCIIPYARGRIRSRRQQDVLLEVKNLVEKGYKEIVLTGIHLSSYGFQSKEELKFDQISPLLLLIEELEQVDGLERIRLGSLEPRIIKEEFVIRLSKLKKVCPHFHLSLQSGCDTTLKRMNRKYNTKAYKDSCDLLRKYFKNPAITTDIIVGFPKESEEEFELTKEFVRKIAFSKIHVFKYSKRKGTVAEKMPDQIQESVKSRRSEELITLASAYEKQFEAMYYGMEIDVLFEEQLMIDHDLYMVGHTMEYIKVLLKTEEELMNCIKRVKLIGHYKDELLLSENLH